MNFSQILLLLGGAIGVYSLADGRPISVVQETIFFGTVAGVEACAERRRSSLIEEQATKAFCARKHQGNLYSLAEQLNGRAFISLEALEGSIKNNTSDVIVTEIILVAIIYDAEGNDSTYVATTATWIAPGQEVEFRAEYNDRPERNTFPEEFCSEKADGSPTISCKSWAVFSAKGIRF